MRAGGSYTNNQAPFLTPATPTPTCSQSKSKGRIPINSSSISLPALRLSSFPGPRLSRSGVWCCEIRAVNGASEMASVWGDKPLEIPPNGKKPYVYLDEMDILTFLDPPNYLIPLDPTSYNPAAYLWKKIGDIPEERRHGLLQLLNPRLISRAWEIAGSRYHDPKLLKKSASNFLSNKDSEIPSQVYNCRTSGVIFGGDYSLCCSDSSFWTTHPCRHKSTLTRVWDLCSIRRTWPIVDSWARYSW
ncbi:hypothetical protein CRYUN_Cryun31cG0132300 [Craigia yunnanensis]